MTYLKREHSMTTMKLKHPTPAGLDTSERRFADWLEAAEDWMEQNLTKKTCHGLLAKAGPALLCSTFLDDGLRIPLRWTEQHDYMTQVMGMWSWLAAVILVASAVTQLSACWLALRPTSLAPSRVKLACYMLLAFVALQPLLYGQLGDLDFMCRSSTVAGGLILMIWGENDRIGRKTGPGRGLLVHEAGEAQADRLQVAGRLLLASMFIVEAICGKHGGLHSVLLAPSLWNMGASLALLALSLMVCVGFKAEWSSLVLSAVLGVANVVLYPFWSVEPHLADFYRFYFFQTLSIMGGLALLALHGPGGLSLDGGQKKLY